MAKRQNTHVAGEFVAHRSAEVDKALKDKPLSALLRIALRDQGSAYGPAAIDILADRLDELEESTQTMSDPRLYSPYNR